MSSDNNFLNAFNFTNEQLIKDCHEPFQWVHKDIAAGTETYDDLIAISIDDISIDKQATAGGILADNTVDLHVFDDDPLTAGIQSGEILIVWGNRVRVISVEAGGDNCNIVHCGPAGIKLK
jgi:hypothetical protein